MAKPTGNLDWATNGAATEVLEPTPAQRTSGIVQGDTWTRRRLNWMFNELGKHMTYLKTNVSEWGTGATQARNNSEMDARYVQGNEGTGASETRINSENDTRFVQHSEVVNTLVDTSTTNPLSAAQGTALKAQADTALVAGTAGAQGRTNTQNDAQYLVEANNLSDVVNAGTARNNLGIYYAEIAANGVIVATDIPNLVVTDYDGGVGRYNLAHSLGTVKSVVGSCVINAPATDAFPAWSGNGNNFFRIVTSHTSGNEIDTAFAVQVIV